MQVNLLSTRCSEDRGVHILSLKATAAAAMANLAPSPVLHIIYAGCDDALVLYDEVMDNGVNRRMFVRLYGGPTRVVLGN